MLPSSKLTANLLRQGREGGERTCGAQISCGAEPAATELNGGCAGSTALMALTPFPPSLPPLHATCPLSPLRVARHDALMPLAVAVSAQQPQPLLQQVSHGHTQRPVHLLLLLLLARWRQRGGSRRRSERVHRRQRRLSNGHAPVKLQPLPLVVQPQLHALLQG